MPAFSAVQHHLQTMSPWPEFFPFSTAFPALRDLSGPRLDVVDFPGPALMDEVWAHYGRLDPDSARQRFFTPLPRDALARRARSDHPDYVCLLRDAGGTIRGAAPVYQTGRPGQHGYAGEIAFSVEAEWRGRGLARRLAESARQHAACHDIFVLEAMTSSDNAAMLGLARAVGGTSRPDGAETHLRISAAAPGGAGRALQACRTGARNRIDMPAWAATAARGAAGRPDTPGTTRPPASGMA